MDFIPTDETAGVQAGERKRNFYLTSNTRLQILKSHAGEDFEMAARDLQTGSRLIQPLP